MLFVDLDKTLIKSDYLIESFFKYFSQNIFAPFIILFVFLRNGKVGLKKFLYDKTNIEVRNLPYNKKVLSVIGEWKKNNSDEKIILISATYFKAVAEIKNHLKCFDESYGSEKVNLKSEVKLKKINELSANKRFAYIGDSFADVAIWEKAEKCYIVNPTKSLLKKVKAINNSIEIIKNKNNNIHEQIINTLRVHQWVKNLLIFIPVVMSFKSFPNLVENLIIGFFAFSFISSALYIINDLFDIENDRLHHSKKYRAFASGSLSIIQGLAIFFLLILIVIEISENLSQSFKIILFIYFFSVLTYSIYLKKIPILDILTLTSFYLLRLIAGGALFNMAISNWLLTFSVFFFLFLASIKRCVEINRVKIDLIAGRGYKIIDKPFITNLSYFSGLISVLVICLYIESQQTLAIYNDSKLLWLVPVILLYWILETLFNVGRDKIDDDPIKYALKSKSSYVFLLSLVVLFVVAKL